MKDIMFDIPSNPKIVKCVITKETVIGTEGPKIVEDENYQTKKIEKPKRQVPEKQVG